MQRLPLQSVSCCKAGISLGTGGADLTSSWQWRHQQPLATLCVTVYPGGGKVCLPVDSAALGPPLSSFLICSACPVPAPLHTPRFPEALPERTLSMGVSEWPGAGLPKTLPDAESC